jgi:xanthine dehydrogenase accessory factor
MMPTALTRRAKELAEQGVPFATATVVRVERPTSAKPGNTALVLEDGTIEGFVGGDCAEQSVREYALRAIDDGESILLRVVPFGGEEERGVVTVQNPCLSGGMIEVFVEPVVPAPRLLVEGDMPISQALLRLGGEFGIDTVAVVGGEFEPREGDLALVVAGHGREELPALRAGLEAELPYVGLVASRRRGQGVLGELRGDGVPAELLDRIDTPAGLDIGARTPEEIALSILANIVAVRRAPRTAPATAVDPVCGMTVTVVPGTPSLEHDGETVYFCREGCKAAFELQHASAD